MKISELPPEIREKALEYQRNEVNICFLKDSDDLNTAFYWAKTKEGDNYWRELYCKEPDLNEPKQYEKEFFTKAKKEIEAVLKTPKHYDNSKGSLYQFCEDKQLNSYEFDIIKRVMRCRKKGNFIEDIDKTIYLLELYKKEYEDKN